MSERTASAPASSGSDGTQQRVPREECQQMPDYLRKCRAVQPGTWSMRHCHQRGTVGV
jgi:hypothetical protein